MYCAGCGTQIQSGLNYCSRCGRRVAEESKWGRSRMSPLVVAGNTAGVGFVSFIFVLLILTRGGVPGNLFVPITFFYFAALFGLCLIFLRHGSPDPVEETKPTSDDARDPAYLRPVTTAQLEEARDPGIGSVTDATTRTLDEVKIERN